MPLVLANRVQETTTTTGTGTVTLAGAVAGFQSFAVIGDANTTYYTITSGNNWEVGIGTYTSSGTTLARTTVLASSAGGTTKITLAGTSAVFVTYPSEEAILDGYGLLPVANGGTGATTSTGTGSVVLNTSPTLVTPILGAASATSIANTLGAVGTPSYTFTGDLNTGMWSPAADTVAVSTGATERMRIDSSGNVGIGGNPTGYGRLAVIGGNIGVSQDGSTVTTIRGNAGVGNIGAFNATGAALSFNTATSGSGEAERMRIDASGNVGIGMSSPGSPLDVQTNSSALGISLRGRSSDNVSSLAVRSNDGATLYGQVQGRSTDFRLEASSSNIMTMFTASTERMRIDPSGDVGIGTASPSSKLHVAGALTLNTALSVANGGTGVTTSTGTGNVVLNTSPALSKAVLNDGYTEEVFAVVDGVGAVLDPNNGSIQTWTLGANRTPTQANWAAGQSITLMIDDGSAFTVTWTTLGVVFETNGGVAPTLALTGYTVIVLWKVGTQIYGARVGDA